MAPRTIADRYTTTRQLGAGGGGTVWQATDEVLGRTVAVKEIALPGHLTDEQRQRVRDRTLREARSAARLEHPSVISIFDVVEGDEALHIVMEHVPAPSLQDLTSDHGPLPPAQVAAIGLDVLDGLAAAHGAGVVHRDVKPSNVLVRDDGPAVVTDFGVAAVLGETGLTRTGEALGTPDYISPEQLEDDEVGPASDLWSLGATLYHAVEGEPPFRRSRTMATIHAVASAEPRPTERAGPLGEVLAQLLTKDPADRPGVDRTRDLLREVAGSRPDPEPHDPTPDGPTSATAVASPTQQQPGNEQQPADQRSGDPQRSGERRRAALLLGGLFGALALVGLGIALQAGDDGASPGPTSDPSVAAPEPAEPAPDQSGGPTPGADSADAPAAAADPTTSDPTTSEPTASEPTTPRPTSTPTTDDASAPLPEGWTRFDGGAYTVGVPAEWEPRDGPATAVDLVAPDGSTYLRAADTDDPAGDVLADTRRIRDDFRSRFDSYEQLQLEPVEYRGHEAVRWEYTYAPDGRTLRAVHLNFSTGERGYSLNYQAPAAEWDRVGGRFDGFTATFAQR